VAFKVGMTAVHFIDNRPGSPTQGSEVRSAATVIAAPPLKVIGLALYGKEEGRLVDVGRIWSPEFSEEVKRRNKTFNPSPGPEKVEELREKVAEVRLIVATQPRLVGLGKKPLITEIKIGGDVESALRKGLELLGKELRLSDVFKEGEFVDVIGVTKGKGFQGVVKRYGVSILQRKSRKTRRGVAAIGPWNPHYVMYTVPPFGADGLPQEDGVQQTPPENLLRHAGREPGVRLAQVRHHKNRVRRRRRLATRNTEKASHTENRR
jgi:large subunit ribosomal protein L3